jgi:hypothetical protein
LGRLTPAAPRREHATRIGNVSEKLNSIAKTLDFALDEPVLHKRLKLLPCISANALFGESFTVSLLESSRSPLAPEGR